MDNHSTSEDRKPTNPKAIAGTDRLDLSLFPSTAVAYGALAMTEGHLKYGGYNFREMGVRVSTYLAALKRHTDKFEAGEWADPVTKVPHLAYMMACTAILIDGFEMHNITDDRPPRLSDPSYFFHIMEQHVKFLKTLFPEEKSPGRYTQTGDKA